MAILLGRTTAGVTADFTTVAHTGCWPFVALTSGQLTTIFAQTKVANPTGVVRLGIYDDSAGVPNNLLGVATASGATGTGVFSASITPAVTIVSGTTYHLGWRNSLEAFDFQGTTGVGYHESGSADFPNPYVSAGTGTVDAILWGEDSPSGLVHPAPLSFMSVGRL